MADMYQGKVLPALSHNTKSKSIEISIVSAVGAPETGLAYNTSGILAYFHRQGAAPVAITLATLAALTTAWTSGGFKEIDATNMPGRYRLDVPDAAWATGSDAVSIVVWKSGTFYGSVDIPLDSEDVVVQSTTRTDH